MCQGEQLGQCAAVPNVYVGPCGTYKVTVVGASVQDMLDVDNEGYNHDCNAVTASIMIG